MRINHKLLGAVFLSLLLVGVWLTYAVFTKKFSDYDEITLQASKIGLQLPKRADVKVRGVLVGEVLDFEPNADGVSLTLGIYPDQRETIPANVTGSILPKTLFGEKYVDLVIPRSGPRGTIEPGARIARTQVSIEVEKVLSDLYPLLTAVQPVELNNTLNALATALEGRGDAIGENLETLDAYLKRMNPKIPLLLDDLRKTAQVSNLYADVLPEVGTILRNTIVTTGTLEDRDAKLRAMFTDVARFSGTARSFLRQNGDNLIRLSELSAAQLRILAKYSPEYPCLTSGIVGAGRRQAEAFRNFTLHIVLETLPNQPRGYTPADRPRLGDKRGPNCLNLPNPPGNQENPFQNTPNFDDGVDEPTGKGTMRVAPGFGGTGQGYAGSPEETELLNSMMAPSLGVSPERVDDLGALLVGPMARGAEVGYR